VFSAGLALRIRMYVALALNAAYLAVLLFWAVSLALTGRVGLTIVGLFALLAVVGAYRGWALEQPRWSRDPVDVTRAERVVARLSAVADIPVPEVRGEHDGPPLSWTTALPRRRPRIHVTQALLERLDDAELEGVLAHELSHIANRDAVLMTVLAAPGISVLRGLRLWWSSTDSPIAGKIGVLLYGWWFAIPAIVPAALARIVSRHRELAADRGAALLTGSPSRIASALLRVSQELAVIPRRDLRRAAANDLLNVVPVRPERGIRRLWATHPRLTTRVRELERLESRLQAG
jgi:heat shock protein HtpX